MAVQAREQEIAANVVRILLTDAAGMTTQTTFRGKPGVSPEEFERALDQFRRKLLDRANDRDANKKAREETGAGKSAITDKLQGAMNKQLLAMLGKLTAILAPAAIFASIIGSNTGGLQVFMSSIKVLGNVLGATFAPVLMMGSAAILSLADMITDMLLPNLEAWYTFLVTKGFEVFDWLDREIGRTITSAVDKINLLTTVVTGVIEALSKFRNAVTPGKSMSGTLLDGAMGGPLRRMLSGEQPMPDKLGAALDALESAGRGDVGPQQSSAMKKLFEVLKIPTDANGRPMLNGPSFSQRMRDNFGQSIQEFRHQNGAQAQQMGIAQAARTAQMNALNTSPFESRITKLVETVAQTLEKVAGKLPPPPTSE